MQRHPRIPSPVQDYEVYINYTCLLILMRVCVIVFMRDCVNACVCLRVCACLYECA